MKSIVRTRRHSKERAGADSKEKEDKKKSTLLDQEKENALCQLDSVIDSYHHKSGSSGGTSTTKRVKKRDKDKSGGTWPKYRGGGGFNTWDINAGTIIYTQKRRERPLLSMYLPTSNNSNSSNNAITSDYSSTLKNYQSSSSNSYHSSSLTHNHGGDSPSPHSSSSVYHSSNKHSHGADSPPPSSSNQRHHGFNIYKSLEENTPVVSYSTSGHVFTSSPNALYSSQPPANAYSHHMPVYSSSSPPSHSLDRKNDDVDRLSSLTPSDTSLDFSVKSGQVGKEELEYYFKKNRGKHPHSDSESNMSPIDPNPPQPLSLPPVCVSRPSPLHHIIDRTPSNSRISHTHLNLYSPPNHAMRSPPSFTPYSPLSPYQISQHPHIHPHTTIQTTLSTNSPRYSSPPTLPLIGPPTPYLPSSRSGDSLLSSPGLDRDSRDFRGYYEPRLTSSPTPGPLIGSGGFYHSASPSLDIGSVPAKSRTLHLHPHRLGWDDTSSIHQHSGPPSYHEYQVNAGGTLSRKKDDERIR